MTLIVEPIEDQLERVLHFKDRSGWGIGKRIISRKEISDQKNRVNVLDMDSTIWDNPSLQGDQVYEFLLKCFDDVVERTRRGEKVQGSGIRDFWPARAIQRMHYRTMREDEYLALSHGNTENSVRNYFIAR